MERGAENYEGIIVTTGTDTLAYSSAALGYAFGELSVPMVTVSANYPLSDERSNGFSNFEQYVTHTTKAASMATP